MIQNDFKYVEYASFFLGGVIRREFEGSIYLQASSGLVFGSEDEEMEYVDIEVSHNSIYIGLETGYSGESGFNIFAGARAYEYEADPDHEGYSEWRAQETVKFGYVGASYLF